MLAGILLAGAARGVFRDAGLDRGDVGDPRAELVADRKRRVDAGVDDAAARIALGPDADLGEVEALAEIVERLGAPGHAARERREEAAAAFQRRMVGGEARLPSSAAVMPFRAAWPACSGLVMVP